MTLAILGVVLSYLLGSVPFAYLAGRMRGVDLREHGSGNLGATNAVRVLGMPTGLSVYVLDMLKGFVAAFVIPRLVGVHPTGVWAIACGVAAIAGHVRPAFLGFRRGGKGVATAGGVFLGLAWFPTLAAALVWLLAFVATGYVSVGSLAAAVTLPAVLAIWERDVSDAVLVVAVVVAVFVFWSHRGNIARLRRGEEHRFAVGLWRKRVVPTPPAPRDAEGER
jgi:glycerol-3-phosphate acyltransferase PlsY